MDLQSAVQSCFPHLAYLEVFTSHLVFDVAMSSFIVSLCTAAALRMQAEERKLVVTWRVLLQAGSDIADKFEPQLCEVAWEQLKGLLGRTRNAVQLEVFLEEEETATSSTTSSSEI